jgi:quercetin dioxygenase-like cupin family protein
MPLVHLEGLPQRVSQPGMTISFVHAHHISFVYRRLDAGVVLAEHAHRHEQVVHVLEGTLTFTVAGDTYQLGPGDMLLIPPDIRHAAQALTPCRLLDTFYPRALTGGESIPERAATARPGPRGTGAAHAAASAPRAPRQTGSRASVVRPRSPCHD